MKIEYESGSEILHLSDIKWNFRALSANIRLKAVRSCVTMPLVQNCCKILEHVQMFVEGGEEHHRHDDGELHLSLSFSSGPFSKNIIAMMTANYT